MNRFFSSGSCSSDCRCFDGSSASLFSRFAHVYLLTPLALLPLIFQRMIGVGKFEYPPGVPVFAVQHIFKNVRRFFEAISDFTYFYPYPNLLLWISLALLPAIGIRWFRKHRLSADGEVRPLVLLLLGCICAYLAIVFSYFFGDPNTRLLHGFLLPVAPWRWFPSLHIGHGQNFSTNGFSSQDPWGCFVVFLGSGARTALTQSPRIDPGDRTFFRSCSWTA